MIYCFSQRYPTSTYTQNIRGYEFTIINSNPDISNISKKYADKKCIISTSEQDICIDTNLFTLEGIFISTPTKTDYYLPKITKKSQKHYLIDLKDLQFVEEIINN